MTEQRHQINTINSGKAHVSTVELIIFTLEQLDGGHYLTYNLECDLVLSILNASSQHAWKTTIGQRALYRPVERESISPAAQNLSTAHQLPIMFSAAIISHGDPNHNFRALILLFFGETEHGFHGITTQRPSLFDTMTSFQPRHTDSCNGCSLTDKSRTITSDHRSFA